MRQPRPSEVDSAFQGWLTLDRGLSPKSARDVVSRLRRVRRFVDDRRLVAEPHAWAFAINHTELSQCSSVVRSQLKRAVLDYQRFLKSRSCNDVCG
jgi:hypothetical protein